MKRFITLAVICLIAISLAGCSGGKVYGENETNITVKAGQEFTIRLDENPTTGYRWQYTIADPSVVTIIRDDYAPDIPIGAPPGSGGKRILVFRGVEKGETQISLRYERSFEKDSTINALQYTVKVD